MIRRCTFERLVLGSCSWSKQWRMTAGCLALIWAAATPAAGESSVGILGAEGLEVTIDDWPWWRGPLRNGVSQSDPPPPLEWDDSKNVLWKTPIPGRGHSSPIVAGQQVVLTTADDEAQYVLSFNAATGKQQWVREVHRGGFPTKSNKKSSHASSTPACDGRQIYVNFMQDGAVYTTALSRTGEILWQVKISDYVVHQGYGSSPALYNDLVIVSADNKAGGAIVALDRADGSVVWRRPRPKMPNYPSPVILYTAGREQLLLIGCELVTSLDPTTGQELWETAGATTECVTSTVTNGDLIYSSGGYPNNHIAAVRADGSGKLVWDNTVRVYVPSMLISGNHLYAVTDAGVAICFDSATGRQMWKRRLGGVFSSSPVLAGDRIYATNEEGTTYIFRATADRFERLAENQLGHDVFATPAICRGRLFTRVALRDGDQRREMLVCIGERD